MKNKIDRTQTGTKMLSTRAIAMVLCCVMLLTAIGSGSVLNAFALNKSEESVATDALPETVDTAVDAAEEPAQLSPVDIYDTEDTMLSIAPEEDEELEETPVVKKDSDLADTGANVDLAGTGYEVYNENLYHINTTGWTDVYLEYWNTSNTSWKSDNFEQVDSTNAPEIRILKAGSKDFDRFFVKGNSGKYGSDVIQSKDVTSRKYTVGNGNTLYDLSTINGKAKVIVKVASDGSTYTTAANSNCIAKVSGYYKKNDGTWTMASTNASTSGSSSSAEISAIYSSTITYTATASGNYTFKGFSTSDSSSLPATLYSSGKTAKADKYNGDSNTTYYAYFANTATYTASITSDGGTIGTEKSAAATISPTTAAAGSTITVTTHQNSGYVPTVTVNSGAVAVTKASSTSYTFTMPAGNASVSVSYAAATYKTVKVYAGTGGSVTVTYNSKTAASVDAGENATVYVYEGDSIKLTATAASGNSFAKWKKNLTDSYSTTAEITETIDGDTVYVAAFKLSSSGSSDWIPSSTSIDSTPQTATTSETNFRYRYGSSDTGLNSELTVTKTGTSGTIGYWADFTSIMPSSSSEHLYFCLSASNYPTNDIVGNTSNTINTVNTSTTVTIKDSSGNTLFTIEPKTNGSYNNSSSRYMHITSVDTSKVAGIAVMTFFNDGSGHHGDTAHYQFYYKLKGSSGEEVTSYTPSVTYYAKDSALEGTTDNPYFEADTTVTAVTDKVTVTSTSGDYESGKALKGTQITVSTTISGNVKKVTAVSDNSITYGNDTVYAADTYYIVGYSFNGVTPQILSPIAASNNKATYTCTYTIPETLSGDYLEITPIYWLKDSSNCCTFYVNGFEDLTVQQSDWGNTLYIYPFYQTTSSKYNGKNPGYGRYPGQPIVNNGGQLYTQIPLTEDGVAGGKTIKGITINNGQMDSIHGSSSYCGFVSEHRQTYDYDDFYKIANEKKFKADGTTKNLESIFFTFKYFAESSSYQHRLYSTTSTTNDDTRYNDTINDTRLGNSDSTHNNYVATTDLTSYANNSNGWERLTDPLGNEVDIYGNSVTNTSAEPLKVISLGYEYNNAGKYATEWSIYHYNTSTSRYDLVYDSSSTVFSGDPPIAYNSSIVPSALVLNSASNFSKYPGLDTDVSMVEYENMYSSLADYAGLRVDICWEHEAKINTSSAYRCDGRWNYTTVDNFVQSDIKIQYYDGTNTLHDDTFTSGTHIGAATGCSAYFTSGSYSGLTVSTTEAISNLDANKYTYEAEASGSYEFVGWYRQDRGDTTGTTRTFVTSDLNGSTFRSTNSTFYAVFRYVASGNMTISHNAAVSGTATTYLGVYLVDGSNNEISTIAASTNTASVTIDKSVINSANVTANNKLKIVLQAVPSGENTFSTYTCTRVDNSDSSANTTDSTYYTSGLNLTTAQVIYVPFSGGIFTSGSSPTQQTKALTYTTTMTSPIYKYNVKFHYTSRYYGEQAWTKTGTLSEMQASLGSSTAVIEGTSGQADKTLKTSFLTSIKPYESNFNSTINWNFDSDKITQYCTYDTSDNTNTYTINVVVPLSDVATTANTARTGYFTVPYELGEDGMSYKAYTIDNAEYGKIAAAENTFSINTTYDDLFMNGETPIVAPAVMTVDESGTQKRYFQYWTIETTGSANQGARRVIGKCYYPEFNYRAFDNYYITAVYTTEPTQNYAALYAASSALSTSVAYIGTSRNQWNTIDVAKSATVTDTVGKGSSTADSGDILYNDFILSFKPADDKLINAIEGAEYGLIIQRLNQVPLTNGTVTASISAYETANRGTESEAKTNAESVAKDSDSKVSGFIKKELSTMGKANNKNRMHYVYPVSNSDEGNATYLFRAYSYMIINGKVTVSDNPAYFYMRDVAVQ